MQRPQIPSLVSQQPQHAIKHPAMLPSQAPPPSQPPLQHVVPPPPMGMPSHHMQHQPQNPSHPSLMSKQPPGPPNQPPMNAPLPNGSYHSPHPRSVLNGVPPPPPPPTTMYSMHPPPTSYPEFSNQPRKDTYTYIQELTDGIHRQSEYAWSRASSMYIKLNKFDEAQQMQEKVLSINPNNKKALYLDAILSMSNNPQKSIEAYKKLSILRQGGDLSSLVNLMSMDLTYQEWVALGFAFLQSPYKEAYSQAFDAFKKAIQVWSESERKQEQDEQGQEDQEDCRDPILWYGIGIFYEKVNSLENAVEAFESVLRFPHFKRAAEVNFRLGLLYKRFSKYKEALASFRGAMDHPPYPLTQSDVLLQIAHIFEITGEWADAKSAYETALRYDPTNPRVCQQFGWFLQKDDNPKPDLERGISLLKISIEKNQQDAMSWYLLGKCFMKKLNYQLAFDAYQQAVYFDKSNPHFWCSIGILYIQRGQYPDAISTFLSASKLDDSIVEIWQNLAALYEQKGDMERAKEAQGRVAALLGGKMTESGNHGAISPHFISQSSTQRQVTPTSVPSQPLHDSPIQAPPPLHSSTQQHSEAAQPTTLSPTLESRKRSRSNSLSREPKMRRIESPQESATPVFTPQGVVASEETLPENRMSTQPEDPSTITTEVASSNTSQVQPQDNLSEGEEKKDEKNEETSTDEATTAVVVSDSSERKEGPASVTETETARPVESTSAESESTTKTKESRDEKLSSSTTPPSEKKDSDEHAGEDDELVIDEDEN